MIHLEVTLLSNEGSEDMAGKQERFYEVLLSSRGKHIFSIPLNVI